MSSFSWFIENNDVILLVYLIKWDFMRQVKLYTLKEDIIALIERVESQTKEL